MKKLKYSLAAKITAIILFFLFITAAFGCSIGIYYMARDEYYSVSGFSFYDSDLCFGTTWDKAKEICRDYLPLSQLKTPSDGEDYRLKNYREIYAKENTNLFFSLADEKGNVLLSNYEKQEYGQFYSYAFPSEDGKTHYTVNCYVKDPISADDGYLPVYKLFTFLYSIRYAAIVVAVLSVLLSVAALSFLLGAVGHRKDSEEIVVGGFDKIPFDLFVSGILFLSFFSWNEFEENLFTLDSDIGNILLLYSAVLIGAVLLLAVCMTIAARLKKGKWWENTVLFRLFKLLRKALILSIKGIGHLFSCIPMLWKGILLFLGYLSVNTLLTSFVAYHIVYGEMFFPVIWLLFNLAVLAGGCFVMLQMLKLRKGGEKIAAGDYTFKTDISYMFWDIRQHAENLNNIGAGMSLAVEERLKSERLKTELITNVSHDIKTPLTSIVNYVDLLKKETFEDERIREYIAVLDRQSARLKKLTEDLVEASKASTGNIEVHFEQTNIPEFISQSIGEYEERFAAANLETVIELPEEQATIRADGRLLWRVFDNLMNNICKYSQPHTRVYIDVCVNKQECMIVLKNISRYRLNISSGELLERFSRGDSSRSTEGSGLGLSIAKSLVELQKGTLQLSVDGDLFKVTLRFDNTSEQTSKKDAPVLAEGYCSY